MSETGDSLRSVSPPSSLSSFTSHRSWLPFWCTWLEVEQRMAVKVLLQVLEQVVMEFIPRGAWVVNAAVAVED